MTHYFVGMTVHLMGLASLDAFEKRRLKYSLGVIFLTKPVLPSYRYLVPSQRANRWLVQNAFASDADLFIKEAWMVGIQQCCDSEIEVFCLNQRQNCMRLCNAFMQIRSNNLNKNNNIR